VIEPNGKVCVVVGVGPGLGLALARRFGSGGFRVAMVARSWERLDGYREDLGGEGVEAWPYAADAGSPQSLASAFEAIRQEMGPPEVLLYNAVGVHPGPASSLGPEELAEDLGASVVGALTAAREVLPAMREAGRGTLLFTGGGAAFGPSKGFASLSVTKAAMRNLALSLAAELDGSGVRVGTVTVAGGVGGSERFAPERIAEVFWNLHATDETAEPEVVYR